jgi:hypothetical protein
MTKVLHTLAGVVAGVVIAGCGYAVADGSDTPSTQIKCSGWSGGCGAVFWIEREGTRCAVPLKDGQPIGIDCDWAEPQP